ncbi:MAG TPA: S8 family serine peptidase [Polyangiaceae bacterium]|nr:S8 family serine peptidase [Polyangiaceae bacterium]
MTRPRTHEELIVVTRPVAIAHEKGGRALAAAAPRGEAGLRAIVREGGCELKPLFRPHHAPHHAPLIAKRGPPTAEAASSLDGFYCAYGPEQELRRVAERLRAALPLVAAYVRPGAELATREEAPRGPPQVPPEADTSDFHLRQRYLDPLPGVDARGAWGRLGALGDGVRIVDLEWAWRYAHEDLAGLRGGVIGGQPVQDHAHEDHGTAVLGVLGACHNGFGVRGLVPNAQVDAVALQDSNTDPTELALPLAEAICFAADRLAPGDLILLEVQMPGRRCGFARRGDAYGYIAPEWWPDVFAAIRYAAAREVLVVEAAGNGAQDLDDPLYDERAEGFPASWSNPFRGGVSSGAIVVAAGAPDDHETRLGFSNYGSRVDAHAWGDEVFTTGYGLFMAAGRNRTYTHRFDGTSSAAAIVAGVLASVQGVLRQHGRAPLKPADAARLLRSTGKAPQRDIRIGNRPQLRELIDVALEQQAPLPRDARPGR